VLDHAFQDVGVNTFLRCGSGCKTGILLRAEKTPQGMKGVFVSLAPGDVAAYRVSLDANGKELSRENLRRGGGQFRIAPPASQTPAFGGRGRGRGMAGGPTLPITRPDTEFRTNDWNQVEILLDANIVRTFLNNGGENGGVADDDA